METLYYNAKVFTGKGENDFADAFRVKDGKFVWAGRLEGDPGEGAVDLRGGTVIPGLIEAHAHAVIVSNTLGAVPCTIPLVHSIEEMIADLRRHPNAGKGPDAWIAGWGYDESSKGSCLASVVNDYGKGVQEALKEYQGGSFISCNCKRNGIYVTGKNLEQYSEDKKGNQVENSDYNKDYAELYKTLAEKEKIVAPKTNLVSVNYWIKD